MVILLPQLGAGRRWDDGDRYVVRELRVKTAMYGLGLKVWWVQINDRLGSQVMIIGGDGSGPKDIWAYPHSCY